jgi:hypothetical protein
MNEIPRERALVFLKELTDLTKKYKIVVRSPRMFLENLDTTAELQKMTYYLAPHRYSDGSESLDFYFDTVENALARLGSGNIPSNMLEDIEK